MSDSVGSGSSRSRVTWRALLASVLWPQGHVRVADACTSASGPDNGRRDADANGRVQGMGRARGARRHTPGRRHLRGHHHKIQRDDRMIPEHKRKRHRAPGAHPNAPPPPCDIPSGCCSFTGALDSHPFFPSHVASGRCVLSAAAAGAPAGVVSAFAEPRRWCVGAVLNVAGCAVCASAAPNNWRIEDVLVVAGVV